MDMKVVGLVDLNNQVVVDSLDATGAAIILYSPAVTRELLSCCVSSVASYLQLAQGNRHVPRVEAEIDRVAAAAGLPAPAVEGIRFVFDPGRGRSTVPVRSAIVGALIVVVVLVATVTFGASLDSLVSHPSLYGWNWDYELTGGGGVAPIPGTLATELPIVTTPLRAGPRWCSAARRSSTATWSPYWAASWRRGRTPHAVGACHRHVEGDRAGGSDTAVDPRADRGRGERPHPFGHDPPAADRRDGDHADGRCSGRRYAHDDGNGRIGVRRPHPEHRI